MKHYVWNKLTKQKMKDSKLVAVLESIGQ